MPNTGRYRSTVVNVRPAVPSDIPEVVELWRRYGEGNVDIRDAKAVASAVHSGGLHCFVVEGRIVGTGGFYPYHRAAYTELGSSCWMPEYRGRGGGILSVCFRAVYATFQEPGTLIVSELYESSKTSYRLLMRLYFEECVAVPRWMHAHAYAANPVMPVRHMVLGPWNLPGCAKVLLQVLNGQTEGGSDLVFAFAPNYNFSHDWIRSQLEQLATGDLRAAGYEETPLRDVQSWMAIHAGGSLMNYQQFLEMMRRSRKEQCR